MSARSEKRNSVDSFQEIMVAATRVRQGGGCVQVGDGMEHAEGMLNVASDAAVELLQALGRNGLRSKQLEPTPTRAALAHPGPLYRDVQYGVTVPETEFGEAAVASRHIVAQRPALA